jgi:AraC-like DNA-binding protein
LIAEVEMQRHNVVVDTYTATWNELLDQFKKHDISIDPSYQRAFRWTMDQQTQYLESLLLSIPTQPIFLAETEDAKFEVIDGLQRFSSVLKFFASDVFDEEGASAYGVNLDNPQENNVSIPSELTLAPILTGLAGLTSESMPETLVRTLRYARIQVILIQRKSSELAKYHVFMRLNRAGSTLANQEIRNCSARLFRSGFADTLMELAANQEIVSALRLSETERRAMGVQENILRLIAFSNFTPETQRIDEFLDQAMYMASSGDFSFTARMRSSVLRTFEAIAEAYPNGEAFRFRKDGVFKGAFSTNLFDIVACGVYANLKRVEAGGVKALRSRIVKMHSVKEAIALTGAGSNTKAKMLGRVEFGRNWFS